MIVLDHRELVAIAIIMHPLPVFLAILVVTGNLGPARRKKDDEQTIQQAILVPGFKFYFPVREISTPEAVFFTVFPMHFLGYLPIFKVGF